MDFLLHFYDGAPWWVAITSPAFVIGGLLLGLRERRRRRDAAA